MSPARRDRGESSASLLAAATADAEGGLEALRVAGALLSFGLKFIAVLLMFCGGGLCDIARCRLLLNGSASRHVLRPQDDDVVTNIACVLTMRFIQMLHEGCGVRGPWEPGQR